MDPDSIRVPSVRDLGQELRGAAEEIAQTLAVGGFRAWIVGGAVRDLALGESPKDVDVASSATPAEVEAIVERAVAVGRAFGTLIVPFGGVELQHTTFRTESSYTDARRPDLVEFGSTLEEDAQRRDFTCNSLYLDPLTDELRDPTGGLEDLRRRRLRCVGDAAERFHEDGLRLLRMARFAGRYGLEVDSELRAAARGAVAALDGVSAERVLHEFTRVFEGRGAPRGVELLEDVGVLRRLFPGPTSADSVLSRVERFLGFHAAPGAQLGFALLLWPTDVPSAVEGGALEEALQGRSREQLASLRPSRDLQRGVEAIWRSAVDALELLDHAWAPDTEPAGSLRARSIRLVRRPEWSRTGLLLFALLEAAGSSTAPLESLQAFAANLDADELHPGELLTSADLAAAGIERGPRWGELLRRAEDAQLAGELRERAQLPAWLASQG